MSVEIIGTGYGKDVQIGENYLRMNVISMWDSPPEGSFTCYQKVGRDTIEFTIEEYTRISDKQYKSRALTPAEITEPIKEYLKEKEYTFKNPTS